MTIHIKGNFRISITFEIFCFAKLLRYEDVDPLLFIASNKWFSS